MKTMDIFLFSPLISPEFLALGTCPVSYASFCHLGVWECTIYRIPSCFSGYSAQALALSSFIFFHLSVSFLSALLFLS